MILTKQKIKEVDLDEKINDKIKNRKLHGLLLIVPTNRKIRYLKRELIPISSKTGSGGVQNLNLETIGSFATSVFYGDNSAKNNILSDASSALLLKQSFQEVKLKYFSHYKDEIPFGTLERVKNVISEYKRNGISPAGIIKETKGLNTSEKLKAEDISNIYEVYQRKCEQLNVKEIGDVYSGLIESGAGVFNENFKSLFPEVNLVIINGFDEFTAPEIEIIDMISKIDGANLFISFDYFKCNTLLFAHLEKCYNRLLKKGFEEVKDISKTSFNDFIQTVRKKFFSTKPTKKVDRFKNNITKIGAANREDEIKFIAKEIKDLIVNLKVQPDSICVVFNLIQEYSPQIRDIFSSYGIPYNLTDRFSLSTSPPIVSVLNFLEILENDFYYRNILRALNGGYINFEDVNVSNLLRVSINLKIVSGLENWKNSMKDIIDGYDNSENDPAAAGLLEKENYVKALEDINFLESKLKNFDRKQTINEFHEEFENLIFSSEIPLQMINSPQQSGAEKDIKAVTEFFTTIDEMFYLFKLEFGEEKKFPLKFFTNNIRTAVSNTRYNIKEKPGYGVQVTNLNEIRHLKFDYLFIGGLVDGYLPTRYMPEIFFSGSFVKNEIVNQTEQRYHFYQSLCCWDKALYLTYPQRSNKGIFEESNFLKEFSNLFGLKEKSGKDYYDKIYSKEELLILIGREGVEKFEEKYEKLAGKPDLQNINKSIEIDRTRLNNAFGDSPYSGFIAENISEEAKEKLESFKENHYSISQLETYAKCPYKYFVERVLELEPIEEPVEEIEAFEVGSLVHSIFFTFYRTLAEQKISLADCSDETFNYAVNLIFKIAEDKVKNVNFNSPLAFYEKEKILGLKGQTKNSILYKFIEYERKNENGFIPYYFEIAFGKLKDDENKISILPNLKIDGVNVRGKIDRIDLNEEDDKFAVIDYKLGGRKPTNNDLTEGISLQLPLYMFAAKELIKAQLNKDFQADDAFIYSLKYDVENFGKLSIKSDYLAKKMGIEKSEVVQKLIDICIENVKNYVSLIAKGKFNLTKLKDRENKVCGYCGFRSVCRIEEVE
jgi:ATP-dependent helicase/nuclease subunit B